MARIARLPADPLAEARRQWLAHGWTDAAPGMMAVISVMRAQQILQARVDATLKPFRLTFARYELLTLLRFTRSGRMSMASASHRLQVHPTSVTNTVDRLEASGHVRREPHPGDGRATLIVLTDSGRELSERATVALNTEVFEHPGLDAAEAGALAGLITTLRRNAGDVVD